MSGSLGLRCLLLVGLVLFAGAYLAAFAEDAKAPAQGPYELRTSVMGAAGAVSSGSGLVTKGTMAQPTPIGITSGSSRVHYAGFWYLPWVDASIPGTGPGEALTDRLYQNFPNPFRTQTTIVYAVAAESRVDISVFNVRGQKVSTLVSENVPPGVYNITWGGRDERGRRVSPGVYFYRLEAGSHRSVKKLLVLN